MNCPICDNKQYCGCKACEEWRRQGVIDGQAVVQVNKGNDILACGYCGHEMHIDQWAELAMRQHEARTGKPEYI